MVTYRVKPVPDLFDMERKQHCGAERSMQLVSIVNKEPFTHSRYLHLNLTLWWGHIEERFLTNYDTRVVQKVPLGRGVGTG